MFALSSTDFDIYFEGLFNFAKVVILSLRMNLCENPDTRFDVLDLSLIIPSWWWTPDFVTERLSFVAGFVTRLVHGVGELDRQDKLHIWFLNVSSWLLPVSSILRMSGDPSLDQRGLLWICKGLHSNETLDILDIVEPLGLQSRRLWGLTCTYDRLFVWDLPDSESLPFWNACTWRVCLAVWDLWPVCWPHLSLMLKRYEWQTGLENVWSLPSHFSRLTCSLLSKFDLTDPLRILGMDIPLLWGYLRPIYCHSFEYWQNTGVLGQFFPIWVEMKKSCPQFTGIFEKGGTQTCYNISIWTHIWT